MKKERSPINAAVARKVAKDIGCTIRFVNQCIKGERNSTTAHLIRKKYSEIEAQAKQILS